MFDDLVALFSGWYENFVSSVSSSYLTEVVLDAEDNILSSTSKSIDVWSAYVPWEHIISCVVLCVFVCGLFRLLRSLICKIL